jgi:transcriptional regulator with XRE-family HTH domain
MAKAGVAHDPKRMDAWDIEVGRRIRARRLEREMSQESLANGLGVSFQQVQKYEKGVNRVGAARMRRICEILKVPITFFYDAEIAGGSTGVKRFKASRLFVLLQRRDSVKLVTAFNDVRDARLRASLLRVVVQAGKLDASRRAVGVVLGAVMIGVSALGIFPAAAEMVGAAPRITIDTDCSKYRPGVLGEDAKCEAIKGELLRQRERAADKALNSNERAAQCLGDLQAAIARAKRANRGVLSEAQKIQFRAKLAECNA